MAVLNVPFGDWAPDALVTTRNVSHDIRNAMPTDRPGEYAPAPTHVPQMQLAGTIIGGFMARSGTTALPYVGTAANLYSLTAAANDVSKPGGYAVSAPNRWAFAQYKNTVIAASLDAPLQSIAVNGAAFGDLVVGTRKPKAKVLAVIGREWVVLGDTTDSVDGRQANRVWWSRAGDPTRFDPDNNYFCGLQDLDTSGAGVMAITGVEYATVLMRHDIWRMTPDTSVPNGFRFDKLDPGNGAMASGAVASLGRAVFYLGERGPMLFNGTSSEPIAAGKWAEYATKRINAQAMETACCVVEPHRHLVWWFLPTGSSVLPNEAIVFNYISGRAAPVDVAIEFACAAETPPTYLETVGIADASLDTSIYADLPVDSRLFDGGVGLIHAVDRAHRWGALDGAPGTAILETGEIVPGERAYVDRVRPLVADCENAPRVCVRYRDKLMSQSLAVSPKLTPAMDGCVYPFVHAGLMRFRVEVDGAFSRALGVDVDLSPGGMI